MLALDAFVTALEGGAADYPALLDGLRAQSIADAAVESLRKNAPVQIEYWQPV
jgi:myo-inositol 2-dehydrogenase/D-chiro-inositol 1-dehydrogenase